MHVTDTRAHTGFIAPWEGVVSWLVFFGAKNLIQQLLNVLKAPEI